MKASEFYHGSEKYNCAQAILKTYQDKYNIPQEMIESYSKFGGGRVDGGICGALYAVRTILKDKDMIANADTLFSEKAGSIQCRNIRKLKKISCSDCVDLAANILSYISNDDK